MVQFMPKYDGGGQIRCSAATGGHPWGPWSADPWEPGREMRTCAVCGATGRRNAPGPARRLREATRLCGYLVHPICAWFPVMPDAQIEALRLDLQENGQRDPILLWRESPGAEWSIVDGRHRAYCLQELGVEPKVRKLPAGADVVGITLSHNLARRDLSTAERAGVAARFATLRRGRRANAPAGGLTQAEAAQRFGVSVRTLQRQKLLERRAPGLLAEVESGQLSLAQAVERAEAHVDQAKRPAGRTRAKPSPAPTAQALGPAPSTSSSAAPATPDAGNVADALRTVAAWLAQARPAWTAADAVDELRGRWPAVEALAQLWADVCLADALLLCEQPARREQLIAALLRWHGEAPETGQAAR